MYVLVLMFIYPGVGVAMTNVPGYKSESDCQISANEIPSQDTRVHAYCIHGPDSFANSYALPEAQRQFYVLPIDRDGNYCIHMSDGEVQCAPPDHQ